MDSVEQEEILYRLDERTKRVDEQLERINSSIEKHDKEINSLHSKIVENENSINNMSSAAKIGGATLLAIISGIGAKIFGLIKFV